jgi:hypothetical protein
MRNLIFSTRADETAKEGKKESKKESKQERKAQPTPIHTHPIRPQKANKRTHTSLPVTVIDTTTCTDTDTH